MKIAWCTLIIIAIVLLGCGPYVDVDLPNDHSLVVIDSTTAVINSDALSTVAVDASVDLLDTDGQYVFGVRRDRDTSDLIGFFILDTENGATTYIKSREAWEAELAALAISDIELRRPTAFFNFPDQVWWRFALIALFVFLVVIPLWLWRRSKENAEVLRAMHNQPGF